MGKQTHNPSCLGPHLSSASVSRPLSCRCPMPVLFDLATADPVAVHEDHLIVPHLLQWSMDGKMKGVRNPRQSVYMVWMAIRSACPYSPSFHPTKPPAAFLPAPLVETPVVVVVVAEAPGRASAACDPDHAPCWKMWLGIQYNHVRSALYRYTCRNHAIIMKRFLNHTALHNALLPGILRPARQVCRVGWLPGHCLDFWPLMSLFRMPWLLQKECHK